MQNLSASEISGVRIWLSGSLPDEASPEQATHLKAFVKLFAKSAFQEGARVLHGFHPSITPTLLEAALEYHDASDRKAPLLLFASTYFREASSGGYEGRSVTELERNCELLQIPQAPTRSQSLEELRNAMASQSDALVAVGGKWWEGDRSQAGVPAEFLLALARGLPVFLSGGLGGATAGFLEKHPEILKNLRNGWDSKTNQALSSETDSASLVRAILDQVARLPLGRRETGSGQPFRILCLDGGGIRCAFTAAALARWEQMSNLRVANHFDLIAGTSTGGILAIGLTLGLSAEEIVEFYRKHGPVIFPMTGVVERTWRGVVNVAANKFDATILEQKLSLVYDKHKTTTLKDCAQRLLITSYNLSTNDLRLYRTSHHPTAPGHDHLRTVVVARATSAAPTYFKPAGVDDPIAPHEAVDGGVWANCPAMAALGEAVRILGIPLDRIEMLSIGTAGMPAFVEDPSLEGKAGWAARVPDLFMNAQMDATLSYVEQLLGDRFVRIDDKRPRVQGMDNPNDLDFLIGRGSNVGESAAKDVMARFVNGVSAAHWRDL